LSFWLALLVQSFSIDSTFLSQIVEVKLFSDSAAGDLRAGSSGHPPLIILFTAPTFHIPGKGLSHVALYTLYILIGSYWIQLCITNVNVFVPLWHGNFVIILTKLRFYIMWEKCWISTSKPWRLLHITDQLMMQIQPQACLFLHSRYILCRCNW
jgi:hypothetical protein